MNIVYFVFLIIFNITILVNFGKLSKKINIFDHPDDLLKKHKSQIPILGGIIFITNFYFLLIYSIYFDQSFFYELKNKREYLSLLLLTLFFFLTGLYDDKYKLIPNKKIFFIIIIILSTVLINSNLIIDTINLSFFKKRIFLNNFSFLFTIFCILLFTNALNFYDGINGQSLIFSIIIFSFLFLISDFNFFYLFIIFILSFLIVLNLNNKLFMGDSGIYALSSSISFFLIYEYNFTENIIFSDTIFFLLFIPCIDLFRLIIERCINGKNAFIGDRNHIHHLLINKHNLLNTNIVLAVLSIFPILLFYFFKIEFFITLILSLTLYFIIIIVTKKIKKNA